MKRGILVLLFLVLFSSSVIAHGDVNDEIAESALNFIYIAGTLVILFVFIAACGKEKHNKMKWLLFLGICIPVVTATLYSAGTTIYLNVISETKGPVHWHADFEVWNCGKKLDLVDPKGMLNRIGTSIFHEHGDDRIHVEGVVGNKKDINLANFIKTVGGELDGHLQLPTNEGIVEMEDWDLCNGGAGKLQAFVYRRKHDNIYEQLKIYKFEEYVLSPYATVPPGDCIIVEFDGEKDNTDKICETYKIALEKGDIQIGS